MKRYFGMMGLGLILAVGASVANAQNTIEHGDDWPDWAYGLLAPLSSEDRTAPPCPADSRPIDCAYIGAPTPDDGIKRSLPETELTFTSQRGLLRLRPGRLVSGRSSDDAANRRQRPAG